MLNVGARECYVEFTWDALNTGGLPITTYEIEIRDGSDTFIAVCKGEEMNKLC